MLEEEAMDELLGVMTAEGDFLLPSFIAAAASAEEASRGRFLDAEEFFFGAKNDVIMLMIVSCV